GRGGDPRPRRADAREAPRARSVGQALRAAHALDLVVRAQALDALPVGALRRRRVAPDEARDRQARRATVRQRARPPREPARGRAPGAPRARGPAGGRLPGARRVVRRRLAAGAPRVGGRPRLLHHAAALDRRAPAVGPLRRRRQEGGAPPRVGAGPGRNAGHRGSALMALGDTYGRQLRKAGLHRVTVSLDTLRPERFTALTRRQSHAQVLAGIEAVTGAGFSETKLDTVVMRGVNDDELAELIEFGKRAPAEVRFIEYM